MFSRPRNRIIAILGFSGAGKDTIASELAKEHNIRVVVSATTRPIRSKEMQGREYNFVSDSEFDGLIQNDELVEYREYNTIQDGKAALWRYGITKDQFESTGDCIVVVDLKGLQQLKEQFGKRVISIFIDVNELIRRCRARYRDKNFDIAEWERRWKDDQDIFKGLDGSVDHRIKNYNKERCLHEIENILF